MKPPPFLARFVDRRVSASAVAVSEQVVCDHQSPARQLALIGAAKRKSKEREASRKFHAEMQRRLGLPVTFEPEGF